jgi:hypothetical protein
MRGAYAQLEEALVRREREVQELYAQFDERGRYIEEVTSRLDVDQIARTVGEPRTDAEAGRDMLVEILTHALEHGRDVATPGRAVHVPAEGTPGSG